MPAADPLRRQLSRAIGWLADRRVPGPLRAPLYGAFARVTGADPSEARLPYRGYPSLGAFFVRRLRPGARPLPDDPSLVVSPCDGRLLARHAIRGGTLVQAKGHDYPLDELLAGTVDPARLEGGLAWTIYLGPPDYHRVHAPLSARLGAVHWVPGARRSVAPRVLGRQPRVLARNERAVLRLDAAAAGDGAAATSWFLVMVGALNVGRIRVVGVSRGRTPAPDAPPLLARGDELARFELGSTVVLLAPPGAAELLPPERAPAVGARVRLGVPLARSALGAGQGSGAEGLDGRTRRLVRLAAAIPLGRFDVLERLRREAPPGEPDRAWREALLQSHLFAGIPRVVEACEVLRRAGGLGAPEPGEAEEGGGPEEGARVFETIYGPRAEEVRGRLAEHHPALARWIAEHAYGRVLARGGLDLATRELLSVAALAALDQERQLLGHLRGARAAGASPEALRALPAVLADLLPPEARATLATLLRAALRVGLEGQAQQA